MTTEIEQAGLLLRKGGLVVFPTETVYGLGANAFDQAAAEKIYAAKGRPADNPLIVHIADKDMLYEVVSDVPPQALALAKALWPGPLTMVLPRGNRIPAAVSAGLDTVAVRFPAHPVAQQVILAAGVPVAAPSANLSGRPSPTTAAHVRADLEGRVDMILDGGACQVGLESTVVTLVTNPPRLLRPGAVTAEQLREILGTLVVDEGVTSELSPQAVASSPGMKHKHYAPRCKVILLDGSSEAYVNYVNRAAETEKKVMALCYAEEAGRMRCPCVVLGAGGDLQAQAAHLFQALRQLDEQGGETAFAHLPTCEGIGLAVYNRLLRAAGFHIVKLRERE